MGCSAAPAVSYLKLEGNPGLTGDIATLVPLVHLTWLTLYNSQPSTGVVGTIPPGYGDMAALTDLGLGNTRLSGTIPPELGRLSALTILSLYNTKVSGTIPDALGQLPALTRLDLVGTGVTGCPGFCSRHPRITACLCKEPEPVWPDFDCHG